VDALTVGYLVAYAAATALYLGCHLGGGERAARAGRVTLAFGWAVQLVDIGARCFRAQHPASSTAEAMAFVAWAILGGFLVATWRYRLHAAGAFAVPAALALLLLARVVPQGDARAPAGTLGTTHVILATVGVATFALAAVLAGLYLVQERQLKRHRLDRLRERGAPLETIDRLAARCVSFGFPVFTLALLTGAIWVARLGTLSRGGTVHPEYALAVASWLAFGVLLVARFGAGWQGRRAAWLTLGGFSGAVLVLAGYFVRSAV
jgi:ABC-type uncharacterized transport system permease subunit